MTYDDWKLRSPDQEPGYRDDDPEGCPRCGDDVCSCVEIDEVDECIGAECVNPHPFHSAGECATVEQMQAYEAELEERP